jgi:predicted DNA-binding transcriptional regulator YafY
MTRKKLRILYLAQFLTEQSDEEHPVTLQEILEHLARCGITADRKSVYDDIEQLRLFGMDVLTVKGAHFGYYLGQRDFQLPELKMLIDVVQASPFLTKSKSMELIGKLEALTSQPQAHQLRRQVYVMNRVRTHNEKLYYIVDGINAAINENRRISFRYFDWTVDGQKAYRRDGALYTTDPVALCVDRNYYLVAYDAQLGDYRHYRLDRMDNLTVTNQPRSDLPEDFDLGSYVKSRFDMYKGDTATVTLRFANHLRNAVIDRFGTDAHMRADGDDTFSLTAPVEAGPTFFGWLFQFGDEAEILSSPEVRAGFADYCRRVLAKYE